MSLPQTSEQNQKSLRDRACENSEAKRCKGRRHFFPDILETQTWETVRSGLECQSHSQHIVDDQDGLVYKFLNSTMLTVATVTARHFGGSTPSIQEFTGPSRKRTHAPLRGHVLSRWSHLCPRDLVPAVKAFGAPKGHVNTSANMCHPVLGQKKTQDETRMGLTRGRKGSGNDLQVCVGTLGRDMIPGEQAEGQKLKHRACFSWNVTVV